MLLKKLKKILLFISTYHDQALIPFKILNKKSINITLGLNYRRLSPAHGTAKDIKNKNIKLIILHILNVFYFKKKYGQNFLIDQNILNKITKP